MYWIMNNFPQKPNYYYLEKGKQKDGPAQQKWWAS